MIYELTVSLILLKSNQALNNGILIDPHDSKAISAALLHLLTNKSLWCDCHRSGLRHIRCFSWPHHCCVFLSHLFSLSLSSEPSFSLPGFPAPQIDSLSAESLRDLSLRFSTDSLDLLAIDSVLDSHRIRRTETSNSSSLSFSPGHREKLFARTADCYTTEGFFHITNLKEIIEKVLSTGVSNGQIGFILSTGSTLTETLEAIRSCHVSPSQFDALICSSGAELCYPWRDEIGHDADYRSKLGFRWPGEYVKETIFRVSKMDGSEDDVLTLEQSACSDYCFAYRIKPGANVEKF